MDINEAIRRSAFLKIMHFVGPSWNIFVNEEHNRLSFRKSQQPSNLFSQFVHRLVLMDHESSLDERYRRKGLESISWEDGAFSITRVRNSSG